MPEIRILPENLVNQIAAGEVVERAASVLKELLDNAIDSGASEIEIVIHGHGKKLIQVGDNGCGMSRDDMLLALERHATSKLSEAADLFMIQTLGFRGEALPSIASVSAMEIQSRLHVGSAGHLLRIEGGTITHEEPYAGPAGTFVSVHSLFFNTPAREKFLKSPATELSHLVRTFKQYALSYSDVSWTFSHEDSLRYRLPAGNMRTRLNDLFGAGFSEKTFPVDFDQGGVAVTGVVGKRELAKRSRGDQYLFVNTRPVQSTQLHGAVAAALRDYLDSGKWPFYVLAFKVAPDQVDVNVHPAKTEVKFSDTRLVTAAAFKSVKSALESDAKSQKPADSGLPSMTPTEGHPADRLGGSVVPQEIRSSLSPPVDPSPGLPLKREQHPAQPPETKPVEPAFSSNRMRPAIYQVHKKYLISSIASGLVIIDQHAAHERILFEKALRGFQERAFTSQQLLFPLLLELDPAEDAVLVEIREDLTSLGFVIHDFGPRAYSIEAVPAGLRRASEVSMIRETIQEYEEFRRSNFAPRDALAAGFACKAAIRTGDSLSEEEITALVDELFASDDPLTCPHGRPTYIEVKLSELDHRFKRSG